MEVSVLAVLGGRAGRRRNVRSFWSTSGILNWEEAGGMEWEGVRRGIMGLKK